MVKQFSGKTYELDLDSQQNVEAMFDVYGVTDPAHKQVALKTKARVTLTVDGDKYTETTQTGDHKTSSTFRLGEEFAEESLGRKWKSTVSLKDDHTLLKVEKGEDGKTVTLEKSFSAQQLVVTYTFGSVKAKRIYNAV
ncbi:fatty acid-binding protein, muscle-like isoform X2 [Schistocerca gregaria]|uniref:fatty acid-binding protein, muscle-like isoform X1 n=1 Tax=Schistocerca gregaria TaxID=7010 RepID=UPI00211EBB3D|nr:fatty acid-binding protein, muscle-like isoform X1 [Schistocerca gregaria]XP_049839786.1 fatty acid-binding protein, muscle-like isoform X2 [Schistocerca gregaria]